MMISISCEDWYVHSRDPGMPGGIQVCQGRVYPSYEGSRLVGRRLISRYYHITPTIWGLFFFLLEYELPNWHLTLANLTSPPDISSRIKKKNDETDD